jgi:hypothetical protein
VKQAILVELASSHAFIRRKDGMLIAYTCERIRVVVAFVDTASPYASAARNAVIARNLRLSAWFTGLPLVIPAVFVDQDSICLLRRYQSSASLHLGGTGRMNEYWWLMVAKAIHEFCHMEDQVWLWYQEV